MAWLSGWTKRIKLTVDNTKIDSALSHFRVVVFLSSTHGDCVFDELAADANRKKIAVTQSDGITQLYCEIEKWDDANESAILHISGSGWSISSSADTDFYLYYLSTQADNTTYIGDIASTPAASVWDTNQKMVQHMVDDTTSTILDSTSNNNDGTKTSANNPLEAIGKVGKGQDFDGGTSDEVAIAAATSINALGDFTFSAAVNFPALGSEYAFVFCDKDTGAKAQFRRHSDKLHCYLFGTPYISTANISAGDHFVAVTRSGTTLSLYSDGALLNSHTVSSTALPSSGYAIGKYDANNTLTLDGIISEAGISNTARNLAWVKATYNSLWDTLLTYGSEEINAAWLSGWTKRIKLTIDNTKVDSALSHFPVTVFLSSTHGDCVFDELTSDANRKKIAVTQSDGTTQLYAEIEKWDDANESAVLHISKTGWSISSSADTDFYLYYLSTQADNTTYIGDIASTPAASVWDSNDKMVQHMVDETTSTVLDSTSNNNDGTKKAANEPIEAAGKIGQGQDFDASDDSISVSASTSLNGLGDFTFLAVANLPALGSNKTFLFNDLASTGAFQLWRYQNKCRCAVHGGTYTSSLSLSAGDHMITATRSGSTLALYLDDAFLNSYTVAITSMGSNGYLLGKYLTSTTYTLDGVFSEARIANTARPLAWVKATYNSLWDTLLTYGSEETSAVLTPVNIDIEELYGDGWLAQDFEELYGNAEWLAQDFEELYGNAEWLAQDFEELWSFPIHRDYEEPYDILLGEFPINYVVEYYRNRATPEISIVEWFGNSATPLFASSIPYGDQIQISKGIEFPYTLLAQPITAIESIYAICDSTLFNDFEEIYTLNLRDPAYSETVQFYSLLSGLAEVHSFAVLVDVDGVSIDPCGISIHGDVNSYCLSLTMEVATIDEYKICSYGKIATVTIGSEDFKFFLEGKSRSREHGKATYIISGMGLTCQLDRPKSATLLRTWDTATTAKAIVEELAVDYIDTVTHPDWWEGVDWAIPANILFANDEPPLDVIRKLVRASGGIVQSYPDGTLRIRKRYPYPVPIWDLTAADFTLSDEDDFFTASESFDFKEGYNKVLISNQDVSDSDRIHIEEVEIDSQTKRLLCYVTIFHEDFELKTSGCPEVTIELIGTVEETIVEVVEIVEGSGTTSKPIYVEDTTKREYLCTQLGSVTFSEDGNLTTEIAGQSLLSITYTTKFREYIVRSPKISQVQFYTETED